jgi:hypothetical protein
MLTDMAVKLPKVGLDKRGSAKGSSLRPANLIPVIEIAPTQLTGDRVALHSCCCDLRQKYK